MNEWRFEPVDPEFAHDSADRPWEHAVRGTRPAKAGAARVTGYGQTPSQAETAAKDEAQKYDAREVLGVLPGTTQPPAGVSRWNGKEWCV